MKIKTITCHNVYNAGASLQAYALAKYLEGLGHDVEIIDYQPAYLAHFPLFGKVNPRFDKPLLRELYQMAKLPNRLKYRRSRKKREYDRFTAALPLTKRYSSSEQLKQDPPEAELYFAGSDQIWNTQFPNGKDPAFYLDFARKGAIRASYAASFATEDVDEAWKPRIKEWLSGFDAISVRETSGLRILRGLGIQKAAHVCDPVFLLPREAWEKAAAPVSADAPYLLVYDFDRNPAIREYCRTVAKNRGWRIYSVFHNDYCDRSFEQEGPTAFLGLIRDAELVVSNSFHATAFALIFERPFAVFRRKEKINTRMEDFLANLDLQGLLEPDAERIETPDYEAIRARLQPFIRASKAYIASVLEGYHDR